MKFLSTFKNKQNNLEDTEERLPQELLVIVVEEFSSAIEQDVKKEIAKQKQLTMYCNKNVSKEVHKKAAVLREVSKSFKSIVESTFYNEIPLGMGMYRGSIQNMEKQIKKSRPHKLNKEFLSSFFENSHYFDFPFANLEKRELIFNTLQTMLNSSQKNLNLFQKKKIIHPKMIHLDFHNIPDPPIDKISNFFSVYNSKDANLKISMSELQIDKYVKETTSFIQALPESSVTHLTISTPLNNELTSTALINALPYCEKLETLILTESCSAKYVSNFIQNLPSYKVPYLTLSGLPIRKQEFEQLFAILPECINLKKLTLTHINLQNNSLKKEFTPYLNTINENQTIKEKLFFSNGMQQISHENAGMGMIQWIVPDGKTGK
jgi:hypothetical protein